MILLWIVLAIVAGLFLFFRLNLSFGGHAKGDRLERIEKSPNYKGGKFLNPLETKMQVDDMPFLKLTREFFLSKETAYRHRQFQI